MSPKGIFTFHHGNALNKVLLQGGRNRMGTVPLVFECWCSCCKRGSYLGLRAISLYSHVPIRSHLDPFHILDVLIICIIDAVKQASWLMLFSSNYQMFSSLNFPQKYFLFHVSLTVIRASPPCNPQVLKT